MGLARRRRMRILEKRGIALLPAILCNAGGVTVSYLEWVQNKAGVRWELPRVDAELKTDDSECGAAGEVGGAAVWGGYADGGVCGGDRSYGEGVCGAGDFSVRGNAGRWVPRGLRSSQTVPHVRGSCCCNLYAEIDSMRTPEARGWAEYSPDPWRPAIARGGGALGVIRELFEERAGDADVGNGDFAGEFCGVREAAFESAEGDGFASLDCGAERKAGVGL